MTERKEQASPKPPPVDRFAALWHRVNDHKLVQWSVAYVAVAYGIQHAIILTSESFEWPNAVARSSMLLLALGLPFAMTFAWYHGARASRQISKAEMSIISILLVIGAFLFYILARPQEEIIATPVAKTQTASASAVTSGISIAVLPFANISGDANQEYFSDGMTEEIMATLAKIPALRVVGRESAFQFKGRSSDNRALGQALGAAYLVEGSVRKADDQVRITAQLVKADDGVSLWTESYDRELKNIFAIQSEIARAIAGALRVPLGLKQGDTLTANGVGDINLYQDYLRARAVARARSGDYGIGLLESIVQRDPNYAPAWGLLARSYTLVYANDPLVRSGSIEEARRSVEIAREKSDRAAREAVRLDPQSAFAVSRVAVARLNTDRNWVAADDLYRQALASDPSDAEALDIYGRSLAEAGKLNESLKIRDELRKLEPFVPIFNFITADILLTSGQRQPAIRLLETTQSESIVTYNRNVTLARAYAEQGRFDDAVNALLAIPNPTQVARRAIEDAARLLKSAPTKVSTPAALPILDGELSFVYAYVGAPDRMIEAAERRLSLGLTTIYFQFWSPLYAPVRKTERFKAVLRTSGLVDYWKARGWPDLCHPISGDDFECN